MPLHFPSFQDPYLRSAGVCATFALSDSPISQHIRGLDGKVEKKETRYESQNGKAWIRVFASPCKTNPEGSLENRGHFHVDYQLESEFSGTKAEEIPRNSPEEVQALLDRFVGESADEVCFGATFRLPRRELPSRGVVELTLDVSTKIDSAELDIAGVSFNVRNCEPYQRIRWTLNQEQGEEESLTVVISAQDAFDVDEDYLETVTQILAKGVRKLVLEDSLKEQAAEHD